MSNYDINSFLIKDQNFVSNNNISLDFTKTIIDFQKKKKIYSEKLCEEKNITIIYYQDIIEFNSFKEKWYHFQLSISEIVFKYFLLCKYLGL